MTPKQRKTTSVTQAVRDLSKRVHRSSWDQWGSYGLTPTQRHILEFLASVNQRITMSTVAHFLGVTCPTASDSIKALKAKGLVSRTRPADDGRLSIVALTPDGRTVCATLALITDPLHRAITSLSVEEQKVYHALTVKLLEAYTPKRAQENSHA